jgi:hypothetical protein
MGNIWGWKGEWAERQKDREGMERIKRIKEAGGLHINIPPQSIEPDLDVKF